MLKIFVALILMSISSYAFSFPFFVDKKKVVQAVTDTVIMKYKICVAEKQKKLNNQKYDKVRENLLIYEIEWCLKYGVENIEF